MRSETLTHRASVARMAYDAIRAQLDRPKRVRIDLDQPQRQRQLLRPLTSRPVGRDTMHTPGTVLLPEGLEVQRAGDLGYPVERQDADSIHRYYVSSPFRGWYWSAPARCWVDRDPVTLNSEDYSGWSRPILRSRPHVRFVKPWELPALFPLGLVTEAECDHTPRKTTIATSRRGYAEPPQCYDEPGTPRAVATARCSCCTPVSRTRGSIRWETGERTHWRTGRPAIMVADATCKRCGPNRHAETPRKGVAWHAERVEHSAGRSRSGLERHPHTNIPWQAREAPYPGVRCVCCRPGSLQGAPDCPWCGGTGFVDDNDTGSVPDGLDYNPDEWPPDELAYRAYAADERPPWCLFADAQVPDHAEYVYAREANRLRMLAWVGRQPGAGVVTREGVKRRTVRLADYRAERRRRGDTQGWRRLWRQWKDERYGRRERKR